MRSGNLKRGFPLFAFCSIITNIWRYYMGFFPEPKKIEEMKQQGFLVKQSADVEAPLDRIPVFVRK